MKKEKGITIVALSVTIIVLLILAGISIKLVLDNNGIIGNAQTAKNQYIEAEANTEQGIGELSNALSSNLNHNRNNGTNTTTNTVNPTPTPEPTKYTLTINAGAGTTTGSTNVQGTSGSKVTVSTPTPPSGYTVILNGNDGVIGTSSTASFKTTYSFSRWNLSGGGSISGTTYTFGNSNGTLTAQYTHTGRSLPTATRSGYTFKGWYTTATGGTKVGDAGTVYTPTSNVTIYAQWATDANSPIITQDTYSATNGPVTVTARSPQSGYTVQITMEDPTVESNWEDISSIAVYENTAVYVRLKNGSTTYSYSTHNVTNINAFNYTSGRGRNTLSVDKSTYTVHYQLNSIPAGSSTTKTFTAYYRVEGDSSYKVQEVSDTIISGGSRRLNMPVDSSTMSKKVYVYVVITNTDGTRTLVRKAWINCKTGSTYYDP